MNQPMVGREVGPYRILQKVAQGGMCPVYKGLHTGLEQEVAIKILSPESLEDPCIRDRFFNEARIQAKLSHPNVIKTLNYIEQEGYVFLIMEFVNGETLDVLLKKIGVLPIPRAVSIFTSVLEAIDFMHSKGIIHRDIKPANIMLSYDRFVKVMDFGIAKVMNEPGKTKAGIRIGTLWYMSPEQIRGEEATVLSDIYSLGVTFYQMVTGRVPFDGDLEFDIMRAHLEETPAPPSRINRDIPKELEAIILKAISKNPKERYQSIHELLEDLRPAAKSFGETRSITPLPETIRIGGGLLTRRRGIAAAILIGAAALAALVFLMTEQGRETPIALPDKGAAEAIIHVTPASAPAAPDVAARRNSERGEIPKKRAKTAGTEAKRMMGNSASQDGGTAGQGADKGTNTVPAQEIISEGGWRIRK